jgi:O-antigen/teichoic acid export membrane protein
MHRYFAYYRSNPFFRQNLVFFLGSVSVGILNYLYYPVLGRLMNPVSFGEVQALVSLFLQLTIFLNVLSLVAVNLIANSQDKRTQTIVTELQLAALWLSGGVLLLTIVCAAMLQNALHFNSSWPFILLAVALVAAVPFTFQTAYLRGRQRFAATSIANMLVAGGKVVFSVALVVVGFSTNGAIGGLIAAQLIGLAYALTMNTRVSAVAKRLRTRWWPDMRVVMGQLKYVGYAFAGSLAVMLLLSLDVILVKYFFDAHTAGLYAGVATVARIIFFLTASVAQVLLPAVKLEASAQANQSLLIRSLLILSSLGLPVLAVCAAAPSFVVGLLMGAQYLEFSSLLAPLATAIFLISILNLFVLYCLALRRYAPIVIAVAGTVLTYVVMAARHNSLNDIVSVLLFGSLVTTGLVAGWLVAFKQNRSTAMS